MAPKTPKQSYLIGRGMFGHGNSKQGNLVSGVRHAKLTTRKRQRSLRQMLGG